MTITTTKKPQEQSLAWYALVGLSLVCATAVLIFVPGVFGKIERVLERMPPLGQVVAALSALSGLAAMALNRTKPVPEVPAIPATNPPSDATPAEPKEPT